MKAEGWKQHQEFMMTKPEAKGPGDSVANAVLTEKQEAFALAYVETGNATEAYRRAYDVDPNARDSWIYVEAAQLLDHPKIGPRIAELNDQARRMSGYTLRDAIDEYEEARTAALALGMPAAAVSAITGKVKLFGFDRPRKLEVSGPNGSPIRTEEMSARDVLANRIAGLAARSRASSDTGEPDGGAGE